MSEEFTEWLTIAGKAGSELLACPSCDKKYLDFRFVGNEENRIGYLDVWCKNCLRGIHVSRVKIPQEIPMLNLEGPLDVISKEIPNFTQVTPG